MTNLALAVGVTGEVAVLEWDSEGPDEGYRHLLAHVHAVVNDEWLDTFQFDHDGDRYMVWCADSMGDLTNSWASYRYSMIVGGNVVLTKVAGPETVSLSWDEINFFTAEVEAITAAGASRWV